MSNISEKFDVYQKVRPCRDRLVVLYGTVIVASKCCRLRHGVLVRSCVLSLTAHISSKNPMTRVTCDLKYSSNHLVTKQD